MKDDAIYASSKREKYHKISRFQRDPLSVLPNGRANRIWRQAARILVAQSGLAVLASIVAAVLWGWVAGGWALAGGFICVGPSALLAARLNKASRPGGDFGAALLAGELLKVALVAGLF